MATPSFTELQGQYLAFIHLYSKVNRQPPAEADIARYFGVAPPSVHEMLKRLEKAGLVSRAPGRARSLRVLVAEDEIPRLI
jgi:Mn-dependent DtxR family transcriptional regulator